MDIHWMYILERHFCSAAAQRTSDPRGPHSCPGATGMKKADLHSDAQLQAHFVIAAELSIQDARTPGHAPLDLETYCAGDGKKPQAIPNKRDGPTE